MVDPASGEVKTMEVFVAILGASQLTYVEAIESQRVEDFISCCENALHYFGGAPNAIVPDNLKSAVIRIVMNLSSMRTLKVPENNVITFKTVRPFVEQLASNQTLDEGKFY